MQKISLLLLTTILTLSLTAQRNSEVEKFWDFVKIRLTTQLMSEQSRVLLYAGMQTRSISGKMNKAKKIDRDKALQDQLMLYFLSECGNGEFLRLTLGDMCGSNTLGNYMAGYITKTYKNDIRYLKVLRQREKNPQMQSKANKSRTEQEEVLPTKITLSENNDKPNYRDSLYEFIQTDAYATYDFKKYLTERLNEIEQKPTDKITVQFVIATEGKIDSIKLIPASSDTVFNKELIRIFLEAPKWEPATLWKPGENSKKQKVIQHQSIPITLRQDED